MYIEKRYIKKIAKVFEALSISLRLVDASGACLVPEDGEPVSLPVNVLTQGLNHHAGRYFYRVLDVHPPLYLVAPEGAPGVEDVLCVADAMIMGLLKSSLSIASHTDVYRRALKQELTEHELVPEDWGGDVICVPVSAATEMGIDNLLEMILLTAEMKELKANPNRPARGTIIEARLDKGRGPVATLLVQSGTIHVGDNIVAGTAYGRVRAMVNDKGERIQDAGPSTPVEIIGFNDVPDAGDILHVTPDERLARQVAEERRDKIKDSQLKSLQKTTLDDLFSQMQEGEIKDLNLIVKADVQGSVEAVRSSLEKLSNDEVRVRCIHGGVGAINESDISLAASSNAIVVGFNVRPDAKARTLAEREGVDVRLYRIIYDAIDEVKAAMKGMLAPKFKEVILGRAEVRQTFRVSGVGTIAGCMVTEGLMRRNGKVRLLRDNVVVFEGNLDSLKRFKDDAREVAAGYECGIGLEGYNDMKEQDVIECFVMEEVE